MNRRQKIIVSITGIFIVLLALVGLTYAYFLTRITGNENEKSISVTTANLELVYGDGNNLLTASNIEPGWTTDGKDGRPNAKIFTVTNNGNATVEDFNIYLENVINQISRKSDLVYTITCENTTVGATSTECEEFEVVENEVNGTELVFPSVMSIIAKDTLDPATETTNAEQHTYTITVTYKEMNVDQSEDMNKTIEAKVNIYDNKTKFLASEIMNDSRITKNTIAPTFTGVETAELGLFTTEDDYGTSYYFRGAQSNNYVNFAGYTWRIVRINGDGSIRLILNDGLRDANNNLRYNDTYFSDSELIMDNAMVGYMYGLLAPSNEQDNLCVITNEIGTKYIDSEILDETSCTNGEWVSAYDATHDNLYTSTAKVVLDDFYVKNLKTNYEKYLADTMFCGDKELASTSMKSDNTGKGYGRNVTYYAASERLTYDSNGEDTTIAMPTLKCANNAKNDYSRYTVDVQRLTNVTTNGDLTYPIGMISADEIVFAGGWNGAGERANSTYYLSLQNNIFNEITDMGNVGWWTMTPKYYRSNTKAAMYSSTYNTYSNYSLNTNSASYTNMIRPVINLKSNVQISDGNGTSTTPYEIN